MPLKNYLQYWTDVDLAQYYLAQALGLMDSSVEFSTSAKHIFWTNHPIGNLLKKMLGELTKAGILEYREEPDYQYRWNPEFKGTWDNTD